MEAALLMTVFFGGMVLIFGIALFPGAVDTYGWPWNKNKQNEDPKNNN